MNILKNHKTQARISIYFKTVLCSLVFDSFGLILVSHRALHKLCQATTFVSHDTAVDCIFVILLYFYQNLHT